MLGPSELANAVGRAGLWGDGGLRRARLAFPSNGASDSGANKREPNRCTAHIRAVTGPYNAGPNLGAHKFNTCAKLGPNTRTVSAAITRSVDASCF